MEPIRHGRARRDTSIWPSVLGILSGSVVALFGIGIAVGMIR